MRIIMVPSWYPDATHLFNGSFFPEQAQMFIKAGYEVEILVPQLVYAHHWRGYRISDCVEQGIRVVRVNLPVFPQGIRAAEKSIWHRGLQKVSKFLAAQNYDLLYAHTAYPGAIVADFIAHQYRVPFFLLEHRPSTMQTNIRGIRRKWLKRAVWQADAAASVSRKFAELIPAFWQQPHQSWQVVDLPVPNYYFELTHHSYPEFTFLHVSHLDKGKKVADILQAFALILSTGQDARLRIVGGEGQELAQLKQIALDLKVAEKTVFTGRVSRQTVGQEMANADCFVLASDMEAGGTVLSEAQAVGTPIICTDTWAGINAVTADNGLLVRVGDRVAIADAMGAIMRGKKAGRYERLAIKEKAKMRYSEQSFINKHQEIFAQIFADRAMVAKAVESDCSLSTLKVAQVNDVANVVKEVMVQAKQQQLPWDFISIPAKSGNLAKAMWRRAKHILKWLRQRKAYQLLHVHYLPNGYYFWGSKARKVVHIHGSDLRRDIHAKVWSKLAKRSIQTADLVLYATVDLRAEVEKWRPDAVYIPNPVSDICWNITSIPVDYDVVFSMRLDEIKGGAALVQLMRELVARGYRVAALNWGEYAAAAKTTGADLYEPMPLEAYIQFITRGKVVLGQLQLGVLGMSELQALAIGKQVVVNAQAQPNNPPIWQADLNTALDVTLQAIASPADNTQEIIDWARNHHHAKVTLSAIENAYLKRWPELIDTRADS